MRLAAKALRTAEEERIRRRKKGKFFVIVCCLLLFIYYNIVRRRRQQKKIKICHRSEKYGQAYSTGGAGRVGHYPRECDSALFTSSMLMGGLPITFFSLVLHIIIIFLYLVVIFVDFLKRFSLRPRKWCF